MIFSKNPDIDKIKIDLFQTLVKFLIMSKLMDLGILNFGKNL